MKNIFKLIYHPKKIVADEILADSIENKKKNIGIIFAIISILTIIDTSLLFYSPLSFFGSFTAKDLILDLFFSILLLISTTIILSGFGFIISNILGNNNDITEEYLQKYGKRNSFLNNLLSISIFILFFEIISFIIIFIYFALFTLPFVIFFAPILALVFFIHSLIIYGSMLSAILNSKGKATIIIILTIVLTYALYSYFSTYYEDYKRNEIIKNFELDNMYESN